MDLLSADCVSDHSFEQVYICDNGIQYSYKQYLQISVPDVYC